LKERAPEVRFALVGTGVEREEVIRLAQELDVLDRTLFVREPVPKSEMPALLAASTLTTSTVIPVRELWQHSANKFFDSFAASRPITINHEGWQADLLRETGAGLVLPHDDEEAAATQLIEFLRDPERLQRSREAAKTLAHSRFNLETLYGQFRDVLIEAHCC
jgi:glycosyltransferase involved in cell wall biosynthesis